MSSDRLDVRGIEPEIIENFKKFVLDKYGKLHTVMGIEVGKALLAYMQEDMTTMKDISNTHTHSHSDEYEQSKKKKKDANMSMYYARLTAIQDRMREVGAWDVETFQNGIAVRFIKELCGGDSRTIQKYYSDLETKWSIEH